MLFTSILFLTVFLPLFLVAYYGSRVSLRNGVALAFSVFFYFWGAPRFVPVVLALGAMNFYLSHRLTRSKHPRSWLIAGVVIHVSVLVYYKYLGFFTRQLIDLGGLTGWTAPEIALPLGVSFITFEQISYLMDVARGDARPARRLSDYWVFLLLFPHSIAGPIFRWRDLESQIDARVMNDLDIWRGFARFVYGLSKKALLANAVAHVADQMFALPTTELGFTFAWTGAITYALQIYLDFSAYSDMAIGLGRMIGFEFNENFELPYHARSTTQFWQRWHISLTSWFRLYLYVPLGGNRRGPARTLLNILIVFVVSGFWHGAAWTYVIWGAYHGFLIVTERLTKVRPGLAPTLVLVTVGWVLFRATSVAQAFEYLTAMTGWRGNPVVLTTPVARLLPWRGVIAAVVGILLVTFEPWVHARLREVTVRRAAAFGTLGFLSAVAAVANSSYNPFIYFRF